MIAISTTLPRLMVLSLVVTPYTEVLGIQSIQSYTVGPVSAQHSIFTHSWKVEQ